MSDLQSRFEQTAKTCIRWPERPDNDTLLRLYALYKQGAEGDVSGPKPGFFDFVGDRQVRGLESWPGPRHDEAKKKYIDLVKKLTA